MPEVTSWSAPEPPAVLACTSLEVGFGGPPQLGVTPSIRTSSAITRPASRFIGFFSVRQATGEGQGVDGSREEWSAEYSRGQGRVNWTFVRVPPVRLTHGLLR